MKISFLGQNDVIDENLYNKMSAEIEFIMNHNDSVDFLFYGLENHDRFCDYFMEICWRISYIARNNHPEKTIRFIKVINKREKDKLKNEDIPFGAKRFDEYFCPERALKSYNDTIYWIVNQIDYIFCYLYEEIEIQTEKIKTMLSNIIDKKIDLTEDDTRKHIYDFISTLPAREQKVYKDRISGRRVFDIANDIGQSSSQVSWIYREVIRAVVNKLRCKVPVLETDILDKIYLYKLELAFRDYDLIIITENEKNKILKHRNELAYNAQIKHIWRNREGLLCIAYDDRNRWFCY